MPVPTERNLVYECLDQMFKKKYLCGVKENMGCICIFNNLKIIWHPLWRKAYNISNQLQFKDDLRQTYNSETLAAFHKQLERELDFFDKMDRFYIIYILLGFVGVIISLIRSIPGLGWIHLGSVIAFLGIVVYFFIRYFSKRFKILYFLGVLQLIVEEQALQKSADTE